MPFGGSEKWLTGRAGTWIVGAAIAGGVVVGATIGLLGVGDPAPDPAILALDAVPVYACPGVGEVGTLHRGDRVLVTGRSGDWLAVRNVRGTLERVFVIAAAVTPDTDLSGLPEEDCEDVGTAIVAVSSTTVPEGTTTTVPDGATTTSVTEGTTTTVASTTTTAAVTTTTAATTATTAPDTTPPSISNASAVPGTIWELNFGGIECGPVDRQSTVSATVSDAGGVASVTLEWEFQNGSPQSKPMTGGGPHSATFGPFPYGTVDDSTTENVTLTIRAIDGNGNSATTTVQVQVKSSGTCFG